MLLYWNNATASGYWDDTGNWWEDSTGTTTPHGALPVSGDSCSLASNAGTDEPTINTATVDLGTGVCDIYGVTLSSLGTIAGGTWTGYYVLIYGAITGGTFTGTGNQYNSGCAITGGTFTGTSNQYNSGCTISGGTFTGSGAYFNSGCTISGGAFTSATANFQYGCSVNGGVFTGWENWDSTITGGIWVLSGTATVNGYTVTGASQSNPGFSIVVSGPTLPAVGNVMYGIDRGDGVTGTHTDPNTDGHTADASLVSNTAHFGAANGTAGTLDLSTYTLIADVVSASYVVTGHDNYTGGSPGSYPTTATTEAAQLVTDQAAVTAGQAGMTTGTTILGVTGTLDMSTYVLIADVVSASYVVSGHDNYSGGSPGSYPTTATTEAAQLVTDQAAVTAGQAGMTTGTTILGVTGTLDMSTYVLIAGVVTPEYVLLGVACYSGGPSGTVSAQNAFTADQVNWLLASYGIATLSTPSLSPVAANGDLSLRQGIDYCSALDNLLIVDASTWPSLAGVSNVTLSLTALANDAVELAALEGTVANGGQPNQSVSFAVSHEQTAALTASLRGSGYTHTYVIDVTYASGLIWAPAQGNATVNPA